jgi:hypothetical protein
MSDKLPERIADNIRTIDPALVEVLELGIDVLLAFAAGQIHFDDAADHRKMVKLFGDYIEAYDRAGINMTTMYEDMMREVYAQPCDPPSCGNGK